MGLKMRFKEPVWETEVSCFLDFKN